ncbi:hypothetical protein JCM10207_008949 [Rhodosporidiobolus poonsookiae]
MGRLNGSPTPSLPRRRGFPQGGPSSPPLFNLFLDSLLHRLNALPDLSAFAYADDIALTARTRTALQHGLAIAAEWADEWEMRFNVSKCALLAPVGREHEVRGLVLAGQPVPVVDSFRYLGVERSASSIDFGALLQRKTAALSSSLASLQAAGDGWPPLVRLRLLKAYSLSQLDYGGPILSLALDIFPSLVTSPAGKELDAVHRKASQWVSGVYQQHREAVAASMAGLPPPALRLKHLALGLALHLDAAPPEDPTTAIIAAHRKHGDPLALAPSPPPHTPLLLHLAFLPIHAVFQQRRADLVNAGEPPVSRHTFLRQVTLNHHELQESRTASYIPRSSRPTGTWDGALAYLAAEDRRRAARWRAASFGHKRRCPECGHNFHRGHAPHLWRTLGAFDEDGHGVDEERLQPVRAAAEHAQRERDEQRRGGQLDAMDFLLGHRDEELRTIGAATLRVWEERMVALEEQAPVVG